LKFIKKIGDKKMKEETYGIVWGTVLLVIGIIILLIAFSNISGILQNPSEKIEEWVPTEYRGPTAAFSWRAQGTSLGFIDTSIKGDAEIINVYIFRKWRLYCFFSG
jgi:hypothetical protein